MEPDGIRRQVSSGITSTGASDGKWRFTSAPYGSFISHGRTVGLSRPRRAGFRAGAFSSVLVGRRVEPLLVGPRSFQDAGCIDICCHSLLTAEYRLRVPSPETSWGRHAIVCRLIQPS